MNNRKKGELGEQQALEYLKNKGYIFLDKNWHYSKNAEIDLIMQDDETLVFIEVKTRTTINFGHPFEAITPKKIENIKTAINGYLQEHPKQKYKNIRIDGVAIIKNPFTIEHLKNIIY